MQKTEEVSLHSVLQQVSEETNTPIIHSGCRLDTLFIDEFGRALGLACEDHNAWVCFCGTEVDEPGELCWRHQDYPHTIEEGKD